jgi:hypothetical protein
LNEVQYCDYYMRQDLYLLYWNYCITKVTRVLLLPEYDPQSFEADLSLFFFKEKRK